MKKFRIDFLQSYDNEAIIKELLRICSITGKDSVSKSDMQKYGRMSDWVIRNRFGSLRQALLAAGLVPCRWKGSRNELLEILIELWEKTLKEEGRRPYCTDLKKFSYPVSQGTYTRRFGSWRKALLCAYEMVNDENLGLKNGRKSIPIKANKQYSRKSLSLRKRFFTMKRDQFTCRLCGACGPGVRLEVDHIVPVSKGGTDNLDNLQTLCFECNRGKRNDLE